MQQNTVSSTPTRKGAEFDTEQAASYLGVTPRTLEVWRCTKRYPIPYIKIGRLVRYRQLDLDAWLHSRTVDQTTLGEKI